MKTYTAPQIAEYGSIEMLVLGGQAQLSFNDSGTDNQWNSGPASNHSISSM